MSRFSAGSEIEVRGGASAALAARNFLIASINRATSGAMLDRPASSDRALQFLSDLSSSAARLLSAFAPRL